MVHLTSTSDTEFFIRQLKDLRDKDDSKAMQDFMHVHINQLIDLLGQMKELQETKRVHELDALIRDSGRTIVEGFSEESMELAFADALNKVSEYFSAEHEISTTVLGLVHLPKGGHRAVLEIHISPMSMRETVHPQSPEVQQKRNKDKEYDERKAKEEMQKTKLIFDHFLETANMTLHVPDYFKVKVSEAEILNYMIEKEFFEASHELPKEPWMFHKNFADPNLPVPEMMVRFNKKRKPSHTEEDPKSPKPPEPKAKQPPRPNIKPNIKPLKPDLPKPEPE